MVTLAAACLVEGEAEGRLTLWSTPLSFWGGLDARDGRVIDRSHPAFGEIVAGRVLAMPAGRGSSSASSVLAEAIRRGTAPAGIILAAPDPIIAVGAIVAQLLYGRVCPVLVCSDEDFSRLRAGATVRVVSRAAGSTIDVGTGARRRDPAGESANVTLR